MNALVKGIIGWAEDYLPHDLKSVFFEDLLEMMVNNDVPISDEFLGISNDFDDTLDESNYYVNKEEEEYAASELYEEV